MKFNKDTPLYSYEMQRDGGEDVLYFNFQGASFVPNLEDNPGVMERVIDGLIENPNISRVVFVQSKNYNYDFKETQMLLEVAQFYVRLLRQEKILSQGKLIVNCEEFFPQRYNDIFNFLYLLKQDPISAFVDLKRILYETRIAYEHSEERCKTDINKYLLLIEKIRMIFSELKIISAAQPYLEEYRKGNREIYHRIFKPDVIPNFTFTRLIADLPDEAEIVDQYEIGKGDDKSLVTILGIKGEPKLMYHLSPPEHNLDEGQSILLNLARGVLIEHQPRAEEYIDAERTRQVFFNIARDLIRDLAESKSIHLDYEEINKLARILVRHTIGFGLVEILLQDESLQDIMMNAPIAQTPIFARHNQFDECVTNILPSQEDADSWAAKFRLISGRPLDEANPILDTQMSIGEVRARVAVIQQPLSPDGLAYALRRHRESPWTLPLFIKNKMINPLTAGLMSFLIDGSRTLLVAGTRSSGKTSLLGSLMLEIMPKYRIIVIEDSLELPVESLRKLNYDILRMKVRSALLKTTNEVSADDGIRTSLRLGDSSLIIGEVRSVEAKALYEAMRVGALANVVAGTIHGGSPYAVFDRVVNDLDVPATSFKATDIIAVANPIKTPDGLHSVKRLISLSEVRKHWKSDPLEERGFVDLMKYNVRTDELEPSDDLMNGDSEILKEISSNVKGWAGNWDAIWDNVLLRSRMKEEIVKVSEITYNKDILEAKFNSLSNDAFHKISAKINEEVGLPVGDRVFSDWQKWLNEQIKRKRV
jgi:flagellar protein FlaI